MVHERHAESSPQAPPPDWLVRLRDRLFAVVPAHVDGLIVRGTHCVLDRELVEDGAELALVETLSDAVTMQKKGLWRLELQAGAFVGPMPDHVLQQSVEFVARAVREHQRQLDTSIQPVRTRFNPERYGQRRG
jgi:hypothetical protein